MGCVEAWELFLFPDLYIENLIVHLSGQPRDVLPLDPSLAEGVVLMSSYEIIMVILTFGLVLATVIGNITNKK